MKPNSHKYRVRATTHPSSMKLSFLHNTLVNIYMAMLAIVILRPAHLRYSNLAPATLLLRCPFFSACSFPRALALATGGLPAPASPTLGRSEGHVDTFHPGDRFGYAAHQQLVMVERGPIRQSRVDTPNSTLPHLCLAFLWGLFRATSSRCILTLVSRFRAPSG